MAKLNLSVRMKSIIDMVCEKRVADVGCDHAFVSIELVQSGVADYVLAMDVKKGPLEIAKCNINEAGYSDKIDTRLSNGLEKANVGEVDCAVIAGMGGGLIVEILKAAVDHTDNGIALVLGPQSEPEKLRKYLQDIGYEIEQENMIYEEGKYYPIIRALPCKKDPVNMSEIELLFGPCLLGKNEILYKFLLEEQRKNKEIHERLESVHTEKSQNRISDLILEEQKIKEAIQCFVEK